MEVKAALRSSLGRTILGDGIVTIGRAPDNGLVVRDPTVSSHHAEIRPDGQGYSIVDFGSKNGTFVNGQRLTKNSPCLLHFGDTFRIGDFTFTYEEEYPTSWRDNTNATPAIGETTDADIIIGSASQAGSRDDEKAWRSGQAPSSSPFPGLSPPPPPNYQPAPIQEPVSSPAPPLVQYPIGSSVPQAAPPQQAQPMNLSREHLQFAAFHPRAVPVETWNTLLVYAYIESALQAIRADAYKFKDQLGPDPFKSDAWASHPLTRGTQITVVPKFQGVTFNPERIAFTWAKDWHRAIFSFNADKRWAAAVGSGEIIVFAGPLIIASLKISLRFGEQSFQDNRNQEEVSASRYRKIFTSYSHTDTPVVLAIHKAYEAIGDDSFLDIEDLRSGQNWNAALLKMIDNSDIFQLFWSDNAAQSAYVYQECQYALQHYKYDGFIRPVYWEKPMRPPPAELSHLHFAYYELSPIAMTSKKNSFFSRFFRIFRRER